MNPRIHHILGAAALAAALAVPATAHADYLGAFGSTAAGPGKLDRPWAVATGPDGRVYVTDVGSNRVSEFDSAGQPITAFGSFGFPSGVAAGPAQVYVSDLSGQTVARFSRDGTKLGTVGDGPGSANGQFMHPADVATHGNEVFVTSEHRFQRFTADGTYLYGRGPVPSEPGDWGQLAGIAVDPHDGNIFTSDTGADRIEEFDLDQAFLRGWGSTGLGPGQFHVPTKIALDPDDDHVWVSDRVKHDVERYSETGAQDTVISGTPDGALVDPIGVAMDCRGSLYVADDLGGHVYKWGPKSAPVTGNLLRNGGFDEGDGSCSADRAHQGAGPGWTAAAAASAVHYGAAGFPIRGLGDRLDGGENLLAGGTAATDTIEQTVDVSGQAVDIDDGRRLERLSGLLGGAGSENDAATVQAIALDAAKRPLGTLTIGPVTAADRGGRTDLLPRAAAGTLPAGTRSITVRVTMRRTDGAYDDAYVDSLALTLTPQRPAPAATSTTTTAGSTPVAGGSPNSRAARRAPRISLQAIGLAQVIKTGRLTLRVRCDEACSVGAAARRLGHRLGTAHHGISSGDQRLVIRLSRRTLRRAIRRHGSASLTVSVQAVDRAGNTAIVKRTYRIGG